MLVAAQFSLSLVVLVAGGLLAASLGKLMGETPGFAMDRLECFRMDATVSGHAASSLDAAYVSLRGACRRSACGWRWAPRGEAWHGWCCAKSSGWRAGTPGRITDGVVASG